MASVAVKENHLTWNGISYFRANAEEVELGSIGEKRTPLTKQNYLEVKDRLPAAKIEGTKSTMVSIDFTNSSKSAFDADVTAIVEGVPVTLSGDAAFEQLRSGELRLVKFSVPANDMMEAANQSPQKLEYLREWGNDARIAHQVWIVMGAKLATQFSNSGSVQLSVGVKGLEATVGGGGSATGSTTIQISQGTCFAYLLAKIDWDKKKTEITDLDDDQWSFS